MAEAKVPLTVQRHYVATMMNVIARGLVAASKSDDEIRSEIAGFRPGYRFGMTVHPEGPSFIARVREGGTLVMEKDSQARVDLRIVFKHITHAFLVFSFQEGTARAFANDRMVADGDLSDAIRLVRCLNRMEKLILPKFVASRAVKEYGEVPLTSKLGLATRIYGRLATGFIIGR